MNRIKMVIKIATNVSNVEIDEDIVRKTYTIPNIEEIGLISCLTTELSILNLMNGKNSFPKILEVKIKHPKYTIVMPYLGKTLDNLVLEPNCALEIFTKILKQVLILHNHNIVHGDLRFSNILYDVNKNISVIDFSHSYFMSDYENSKKFTIRSYDGVFGTYSVMPPEIFSNEKKYVVNEKIDIWSLGCILYALLKGSDMFFEGDININVNDEDYKKYTADKHKNMSLELEKINDIEGHEIEKQIMKSIFQMEPDDRPNVRQILDMIGEEYDNITMYDATYTRKYYYNESLYCPSMMSEHEALLKYIDNLYSGVLKENIGMIDRFDLRYMCHMIILSIFTHDIPISREGICDVQQYGELLEQITQTNMKCMYEQ